MFPERREILYREVGGHCKAAHASVVFLPPILSYIVCLSLSMTVKSFFSIETGQDGRPSYSLCCCFLSGSEHSCSQIR